MSFTTKDFALTLRPGYTTAALHEIAAGDFNGDGKLDLTFSYFLYPLEDRAVPIRVLIGDGAGGFTDSTTALFGATPPATVHGRQIVVADFNRDGRADAFFADHGLDAAPYPGARNALFLSSGATALTNAVGNLPSIADFSHSAAAGDVDGDGDIDLFVGNQGDGDKYPYLLLNNGSGGFTLSRSGLPTTLHSGDPGITTSTLFDADGDGDLDLFLGPWDPRQRAAVILENDGKGNFLTTLTTINIPAHGTSENVIDSKAVDIDGDGDLDLVVNTVVDFFNVGSIRFYINDGKGHFTDETDARLPNRSADSWNTRVQFADLNGDGKVDMLVSNGTNRPVFLNDGTGRFIQTDSGFLPGATSTDKFYAGDFNGDGRMDVFAVGGTYDGAEHFRLYLADGPNAAISTAISSILRTTNATLANDLSNKIASGALTQAAAVKAVVDAADATTAVASMSYQFFTGKIPTQLGFDFLVSPTGPNPNSLNSPLYTKFDTVNRFINFAANLGKYGEAKDSFGADYGSLSLFEATRKAYGVIFGSTPNDAKVEQLLNGRVDYLASFTGDTATGIGTKAAMVGFLLAAAATENVGVMAKSNDAWLTDLADGAAPYAVNILDPANGYYKADFMFGG